MSTGRLGAGDTAIQPTIFDAKADILTATAADTPARLAVGSNNQVLTVDSSTATGLKWGSSPQSLMTATGDLLYASSANTPARLAIGSTSQVLTVSGGVPAWATPATNALTLINTTTFSAVATQNIDNVFTSTYQNYKLIITVYSDSNNRDLRFRLRRNGSDITTSYRSALYQLGSGGTLQSITGSTGYIDMGRMRGDSNSINAYDVTVYSPANSTGRKPMSYTGWNAYGDPGSDGIYWGGGDNIVDTNGKDGFALYTGTGTITGTVRVYGLAN